jgi:hypothetical protein
LKRALLQYLVACYLVFVATLLALAGMGFLVAGLYLLLSDYLVTWAAALATGIVVLVVLLVLLLIATLVARSGNRDSTAHSTKNGQAELGDLMVELLRKSNFDARDASLLALVAGILLGASPDLRQRLFGGGAGPG